jgi:dienelactone hydrolase
MRERQDLMRRWLLCAAGLLVACRAEPIPDPIVPDDGHIGAGPDEAVDPSVPGPFAVGVSTFTVEDPSRPDPLTNAPRSLTVEVWYPAEESSRALPREEYGIEDLFTEEALSLLGIDPSVLQTRLLTDAARDAAPRPAEGPYPLVIFSHGNGGIRMQSTFLTVHLASHGYVVVAMDHQGNTISDVLLSGSGLPEDILQVARDRPADCSVVIDALLARNQAPGDLLEGLIDPEEIGITGHSFGGFTSLAVSALDPRIDASAPLAPPGSFALAAAAVNPSTIPVDTLILAGGKDQTLPFEEHQQEIFNQLPDGQRLLIDILTAGHFTFSDICIFDLEQIAQSAGIDSQGILDDGCGAENIDPERGHEITNAFVAAFFNASLRDSFPSRLLLRDMLGALDPQEATAEIDLSFPIEP